MANRRFEMYEYRQVSHRMRLGDSDRAIAESGLMGRAKCRRFRAIAQRQGWFTAASLPDDPALLAVLAPTPSANPTRQSLSREHSEQIRGLVEQGVWGTTIFRTLVERFGFTGSYSSVRRLVQKLRGRQPKATCILEFSLGEAAQVDFGKGTRILDALTGVLKTTWVMESRNRQAGGGPSC